MPDTPTCGWRECSYPSRVGRAGTQNLPSRYAFAILDERQRPARIRAREAGARFPGQGSLSRNIRKSPARLADSVLDSFQGDRQNGSVEGKNLVLPYRAEACLDSVLA